MSERERRQGRRAFSARKPYGPNNTEEVRAMQARQAQKMIDKMQADGERLLRLAAEARKRHELPALPDPRTEGYTAGWDDGWDSAREDQEMNR